MSRYRKASPVVGLLLAAALAVAFAGFLRTRMLVFAVLDARVQQMPPPPLSLFSLREEMNGAQAQTRVNGWRSVVQEEEVWLSAGRGRRYARLYQPLDGQADAPWAIALHGGTGTDGSQLIDVACELSLAGYRVLTPDLAGHGKSEGLLSSLGPAEAEDVHAWIDWILKEDIDAEIVIFGMDEGAVAALLAAGQRLNPAVKAIAADSAYASVRSRAMQLLESRMRISAADSMLFAAAYRIIHGVSLKSGEVCDQIRNLGIPLLLIHGTGDEDVPAWQSEDMLYAAGENAQLLFAEGAGHGGARLLDPKAYYEALSGFFDEALNP